MHRLPSLPARNHEKVRLYVEVFSDRIRELKDRGEQHPYAVLCEEVMSTHRPRTLKRRLPAEIDALQRVCKLAGKKLVFEAAWLDAAETLVEVS